MRYISLDLETTGLDPTRDQVLSLAMVAEDTEHPNVPLVELPHLHLYVKHERYSGDAFALALNVGILKELAAKPEDRIHTVVLSGEDLGRAVAHWLGGQGISRLRKGTLAGKNVAGFDLQFLPWLKDYFHHRVIDAGSVFIDWKADKVPSLIDLSTRLGTFAPTHGALDDARAVIDLLRKAYT